MQGRADRAEGGEPRRPRAHGGGLTYAVARVRRRSWRPVRRGPCNSDLGAGEDDRTITPQTDSRVTLILHVVEPPRCPRTESRSISSRRYSSGPHMNRYCHIVAVRRVRGHRRPACRRSIPRERSTSRRRARSKEGAPGLRESNRPDECLRRTVPAETSGNAFICSGTQLVFRGLRILAEPERGWVRPRERLPLLRATLIARLAEDERTGRVRLRIEPRPRQSVGAGAGHARAGRTHHTGSPRAGEALRTYGGGSTGCRNPRLGSATADAHGSGDACQSVVPSNRREVRRTSRDGTDAGPESGRGPRIPFATLDPARVHHAPPR